MSISRDSIRRGRIGTTIGQDVWRQKQDRVSRDIGRTGRMGQQQERTSKEISRTGRMGTTLRQNIWRQQQDRTSQDISRTGRTYGDSIKTECMEITAGQDL